MIRGTEKVEEGTRGKKANKEDERERISEERDCEDEWNDNVVLDAEVGEVFVDTKGGFGEGLEFWERRAVRELRPGAALVEAVVEGGG